MILGQNPHEIAGIDHLKVGSESLLGSLLEWMLPAARNGRGAKAMVSDCCL